MSIKSGENKNWFGVKTLFLSEVKGKANKEKSYMIEGSLRRHMMIKIVFSHGEISPSRILKTETSSLERTLQRLR